MRLIKLTDEKGFTRGRTHWQVGTTHTAAGTGTKLCSNGVIHAYTSELLAALMNPAHSNFQNPLCFEAEGDIITSDGTKVGCKSLTIIGIVKLPKVTITQRVSFGILCAKEVYIEPKWSEWADEWLSGEDRSKKSANAAAYAADAAANAAANAAAAYAAYDATATYAAYAAATATAHAANAADATVRSGKTIDFQTLAEKALTYA
jgi:hypothetical protein